MFATRYRRKLDLQQRSGLLRNPPRIDRREGKFVWCETRRLVNFASNDYLGLGSSATLAGKTAAHFAELGSSASSSRLVSGNYRVIGEAEKAFADYFGYEAALFYPSGYQANVGVLSTLFESGDTLFFDKRIHASSVKGMALSGATLSGYNHNRLAHLDKRLQKSDGRIAVATESLFSMDGDCLDCTAFGDLKRRFGFFSVVDEAHAFGVLGSGGRGLAREVADVAVGTMGKALGLFGAFVLLTNQVKQYLMNFSSPQIYTTSLPAAHAASAMDALALMAEADDRRRHLADLSRWLKSELCRSGFDVSGDAHILSVHMGLEQLAVDTARRLYQAGLFVLPARYPTVPLQKAILRVSLTSAHDQDDALLLINTLKANHEKRTQSAN